MSKGLRHHFALWATIICTFLILDYSMRVDDVLYGLNLSELTVNAAIGSILSLPLCLLLAFIGAALETYLGSKVSHYLAVFAMATVQLWSLKVGFAENFKMLNPHQRTIAAAAILVLTLVGCFFINRSVKDSTWKSLEKICHKIVLAWFGASLIGLGAHFIVSNSQPREKINISKQPSLIFITIDSLGAQNTTIYGYERDTTPNLAKLAQKSLVFERFHANFNVTGYSLPCFNGYLRTEQEGETLANILSKNGYPYRAYFGNWAPELFSLHGFNHFALTRIGMLNPVYKVASRQFTEPELRWLAALLSEELPFFNPYSSQYLEEIFWKKNHYPPEISLEQALNYLKAHPRGSFVWVHLWPPHFPYAPDPDTANMFGPAPDPLKPWINAPYPEEDQPYVDLMHNYYDQYVYDTDRKLGSFLDKLERSGLLKSSLLMVSTDHGESFERGYVGHSGWPLMESITHVPLIIHSPQDSRMRKIATTAQQLDIAPTIIELLGLPASSSFKGESLVPYIKNPNRISERPKVSISLGALEETGGQIAVYQGKFKLMFLSNDPKTFRLYDLFKDPKAINDISSGHPQLVKSMMGRVRLAPAEN